MLDKFMAKIMAIFACIFIRSVALFTAIDLLAHVFLQLLIGGAIVTVIVIVWRLLYNRYRRW